MLTYGFDEDVVLIGFSGELLTLSLMMQIEAIKSISNFFEALETLISLIGVAN